MNMYIQLAGGLVVLLVAAEIMIRGAVGLARSLGMSALMIGMTVVALGTSAPELVVAIDAALAGVPGVATGNVVGSNIANVLLIVGAAALIAPIARRAQQENRDAFLLFLFTAIFVALGWSGTIGPLGGGLLIAIFVGYMGFSYWKDARDPASAQEHAEEADTMGGVPDNPWLATGVTLVGLAGIAWGADLMVDGGVAIARALGWSEEVIGLTLIAIGTSLPELAASAVAARRGHPDVALGNILGSNMFNMLAIAGITAFVVPLPVSDGMRAFDLWVMLGCTVLVAPVLMGRMPVGRRAGMAILIMYAGYLAAQGAGLSGQLAERLF